MMFKRIQMAADGNCSALQVTRKTIAFASQFDALLKIVVVNDQRVFSMPRDVIPDNSLFGYPEVVAAKTCTNFCLDGKKARFAGLSLVEVEIPEVAVVDKILAAVGSFKADLLVSGATGKTGESWGEGTGEYRAGPGCTGALFDSDQTFRLHCPVDRNAGEEFAFTFRKWGVGCSSGGGKRNGTFRAEVDDRENIKIEFL